MKKTKPNQRTGILRAQIYEASGICELRGVPLSGEIDRHLEAQALSRKRLHEIERRVGAQINAILSAAERALISFRK